MSRALAGQRCGNQVANWLAARRRLELIEGINQHDDAALSRYPIEQGTEGGVDGVGIGVVRKAWIGPQRRAKLLDPAPEHIVHRRRAGASGRSMGEHEDTVLF